MAFDQHIEADRIDDFNLFSAFVRVPLLILEGVLGNQKQSCDTKDRLDSIDKGKRTSSPPQSPPRVVSDDDLATPQQQYETVSSNVLINRMNQTYAALSRSPSSKSSTDLSSVPTKGLKRTSKMSWSDESGRSLVEYSDESVRHEPVSPYQNATSTIAPKPVKSAMRRSRSIRNEMEDDESKRYIPNMKKSKGIILPTRPYGGGKDHHHPQSPATGEFSPQWGWYTAATLTPPENMMYSTNKKRETEASSTGSSSSSVSIIHEDGNSVFHCLQNSKASPIGWTSVPI